MKSSANESWHVAVSINWGSVWSVVLMIRAPRFWVNILGGPKFLETPV